MHGFLLRVFSQKIPKLLWLSYDHFCVWIEEPKRGDLLAKAFPSCKDGKIYLKCRKCQHLCLIYGSISRGWIIGQLKKHLNSSTECAVIDVNNNTTSMVPSDILTVSQTLLIIPLSIVMSGTCLWPFIACGLLIFWSDFCCWFFNSWMLIGTQTQRKCKFQAWIHC